MKKKPAADVPRVIAADTDLHAAFNLPAGTQIQFLGNPILALSPSTNNLTASARFLLHPLIHDRFFFSLPRPLWDELLKRLGPTAFDPELAEVEEELSQLCDNNSCGAGTWRGRVFKYPLLNPLPKWQQSPEAPLGKAAAAKLNNVMRIHEERVESLNRDASAYAGWLLTNRDFLDEHDALFEKWSEMVRRWGLDKLGIVLVRQKLHRHA